MTTVLVDVRGVFTVTSESRDVLEKHTDAVLQALLVLEITDRNLTDSTLSVDLHRKRVEIEVTVSGPSFEEAVTTADSSIRAAIHAAGGATPQWQKLHSNADLVSA